MWQKHLQIFIKLSYLVLFLSLNACASPAYRLNDTKSDPIVLKRITTFYQNWQKTPYKYGGNTKKGIDCSGLVMKFYSDYYKKALPRVTEKQSEYGDNVTNLIAGDLVFFKTGKGKTGLHVGIYYKNGKFLHVSSTKGVTLSNLTDPYWHKRYWKATRVLAP
ncbi:NlpC/P60 family protein [Orbaceae bacterium ac157xtp]